MKPLSNISIVLLFFALSILAENISATEITSDKVVRKKFTYQPEGRIASETTKNHHGIKLL